MLPGDREDIELHTDDGLTLVGELALPERRPVATLVSLHPLADAGGFMDSHILRKAAARLPALADLAVLRFNTRGTSSPRGTSGGEYDGGVAERYDVAAAMALRGRARAAASVAGRLVVRHRARAQVRRSSTRSTGAILLSPPLHRTTEAELARWDGGACPWSRSSPSSTTTCVPPRRGSGSRRAGGRTGRPSRAASTCGSGRSRRGAC